MTRPRPVVHAEDVQRAQAVLDAWRSGDRLGPLGLLDKDLANLRGLMVAAFSECRTDAYNDGYDDHANGVGL